MRTSLHRGRRGPSSVDDGFTLIEVLVSLVLLSLIFTAVTTLFIRSLRSADGLQDKQAAVPVSTQALDLARSIPAVRDATGNSKLVAGRSQAAVTAQWAAVVSLDGVDLTDTYATWDTTATSTSTATLPLTTTVLVSGQSFNVQTLVGVCYRASVDSDCVKLGGYSTPPAAAPAGQVMLYRVIVIVTFTAGNNADCAAGCTYVTSTLIDPSTDPTFNTNDSTIPPPMAVGDSASLNAANPGNSTFIDVLGNDSGTFSTYPVIIGVTPTRGTVSASSTGIVTYTANNGASGTDYFTYYLSDVTGRTSTAATVAVTINPRASADGATTGQGKAVVVNVKANDIGTYPSSGTSCVTVTEPPAHGSLVLGTCGSITYTPTGSWTGTDSFKYTITDTSALESNEVTATVTVYPPPTAAADSATTNASVAVSIPVQSNDTRPAGSATTSIVSPSSNGTATVSGTNVTFTPNANYSGTTSFTYKLTDPYGNTSNTVTVTVVVKPSATPLAASGTGVGKSVSSSVASNVKGAFSGTYVSATSAAGGTVSASGGTLTYTPKPGYSGNDTVTYTVTDTSGQTATSTWSVSVAAAPNALDDAVTLTGGAAGTATTTYNVTGNDSVPGGIQSVTIVTGPASGTASMSGNNVVYTSAVGFSGAVTLTYRVTDVYGNNDTATFTVTVNKPAAPVAVADSVSVKKSSSVTISVLGNDSYAGGVASIAIVSGPTPGTAAVQGSGTGSTIKYTATSTTGNRTFTYRITDLYGQVSAAITVTVTVTN